METINKNLSDWNLEVTGKHERYGTNDVWHLRLTNSLMMGFGRRWTAKVTHRQDSSRVFFNIGRNQGEAFAKVCADVEAGRLAPSRR